MATLLIITKHSCAYLLILLPTITTRQYNVKLCFLRGGQHKKKLSVTYALLSTIERAFHYMIELFGLIQNMDGRALASSQLHYGSCNGNNRIAMMLRRVKHLRHCMNRYHQL